MAMLFKHRTICSISPFRLHSLQLSQSAHMETQWKLQLTHRKINLSSLSITEHFPVHCILFIQRGNISRILSQTGHGTEVLDVPRSISLNQDLKGNKQLTVYNPDSPPQPPTLQSNLDQHALYSTNFEHISPLCKCCRYFLILCEIEEALTVHRKGKATMTVKNSEENEISPIQHISASHSLLIRGSKGNKNRK